MTARPIPPALILARSIGCEGGGGGGGENLLSFEGGVGKGASLESDDKQASSADGTGDGSGDCADLRLLSVASSMILS